MTDTNLLDSKSIPAHSRPMGQKTFKRLRKLAHEMAKMKTPSSSLPEAYNVDGRRQLNPGREKGTYRWLKKNLHLTKRK